MGNAITQDARAIWLSMVSEGGWWTANNLRLHWSPTFTELEMVEALSALAGGGFIERREFQCRVQYCFTSSCKQLPGAPEKLSINTGAIACTNCLLPQPRLTPGKLKWRRMKPPCASPSAA